MIEQEMTRTCEAEDVTLYTLTKIGATSLRQADVELREATSPFEAPYRRAELTDLARQHVRDVKYSLAETKVSTCPFEGLVVVRFHGDEQTWDCPMCETQHADDWGPDEGNPDMDRKYRAENE